MSTLIDFLAVVARASTLLIHSVLNAVSRKRSSEDHGRRIKSQLRSNSFSGNLPVELISEILRHLHHHEMTLRSCSLVCSAWTPLSRYHLFYRIYLNHSNASAFVALLQSDSGPSIGAFVRQLTIYRELSHAPWLLHVLPIVSSYIRPTSLFLNLQNSLYRDFDSGILPIYKEDLSIFRHVFRETVKLILSLDCDTFAEGVQVVCAFPLLETLELHSDWYLGLKSHVPSDTLCLPSRLRSIACFQGGSPFFLWLLSQPHPPPVSRVFLRDIYVTDTVRLYIQTLGANLEHLTFEPNFHQSTKSADHRSLDISENHRLRSIVFHSQADVISAACHLLSQVRSTDIEKVEIGLSKHAFPSTHLADLEPPEEWSRLDTLLSTPQFSKLWELKVTIPWCSPREIGRLLPLSKVRGILCVPI